VDSALTHLKAAPTSLWERPAPSTVRGITTKIFPWLKPAPLREVASNGSNAKTKADNSKQSPETIAAAVKELSTRLDHQS
ncbi:hypothetical protein WAJ61_22700, partial [Acinetobacter baumannii]